MTEPGAREAAVMAAVRERRELVNDAIPEELPVETPERLYEASRYLLDAGGKRLRPTVLLLAGEALAEVPPLSADYRAFPTVGSGGGASGSAGSVSGDGVASGDEPVPGGESTGGGPVDLLRAAVSVEIIQSFTLIHDDIMDDDDLRRGVAAVHAAYDVETAILAGDTLYAKAFEVMLETGAPAERSVRALSQLADTCTKICEGQAMDVGFEDRVDVGTDEYMEMVELKTAVLYATSASIPAILLGADDDTVEALYGYGLDVGRAFQIQDDVLDLTVPSETLGKQRGSDLVENKKTLITQHAREQGVDVAGLVDADEPAAVTEAEIDDAVEELRSVGSISFARERARSLADEGKEKLSVLPDGEARSMLAEIADYLIERGY